MHKRTLGSHATPRTLNSVDARPQKRRLIDDEHGETQPTQAQASSSQPRSLQNPTASDPMGSNYQYHQRLAPSTTSTASPATQIIGKSPSIVNSSTEVVPQWNMYPGGRGSTVFPEAFLPRFDQFESARMAIETPQGLFHSGLAQPRVHNSFQGQPLHVPVSANSVSTHDVVHSNAFFQNAHNFNIGGNPTFQNQNIGSVTNIYGGTHSLHELGAFVSFDAQFDSSTQDPQRQCHPGTRENVLKRLRDWMDNPNPAERVFWLYGPAGAGKSAIAQTIAYLYDRKYVFATFFFFRSDVNRNDGNRLFTTLAYQLAFSMPDIRAYISKSLSERPDLPKTGVETQFSQLLIRPFHVLGEDAIQQWAPAVDVIINIFKKYQELAPVIIIDGVDECTKDDIQQRFLKVIGDAVTDKRFPLRFLIVSRPELHIEQAIRRFPIPVSRIDLAMLDDASKDIEKFLVDEFSRIAFEQGLDLSWPGKEVINDIVYKSSGNFILASVIIRFVGDPDNFAETQLDIVRNLKPPTTTSPFAVLDHLFLEILRRVPDQVFLKRYLDILTARIAVSGDYEELHKDDTVLMHVSEKELHAKLRRMRSILKLEHRIDVHHRSFIDFLHDSLRSSEYHIPKETGIRRYLELFVDSLVRYVSSVITRPDHHSAPHFAPRFKAMIKDFPPKIKLPSNQWQALIQPLLDLQDNLLQLPDFASDWRCDECAIFHPLRELLHLGLHQGILKGEADEAHILSIMNIRKRKGVVSLTTIEPKMVADPVDLDGLLLSLFSVLPEAMANWPPNGEIVKTVTAILRFDSAKVARSVRFLSDAQKLFDLLVYLIDEKNVLSRIDPDATRRATTLGLEIFSRVPILPLSSSVNGHPRLHPHRQMYINVPILISSQTAIASRILDHRHVVRAPVVAQGEDINTPTSGYTDVHGLSMYQWRQTLTPSPVTAVQIMLDLAKAIQYFHSLDVILEHRFNLRDVFLDSNLHPRILCLCSTSWSLLDEQSKKRFSPEGNIFSFGCLFYELFSGIDTIPPYSTEENKLSLMKRISVPEMPEYAWELIGLCCAQNPACRPTMDEIVMEMESWKAK